MKQVSQQIIDQLNQNNLLVEIENLSKTHGGNVYGDVTLKEAFDKLVDIKSLIEETSKNGMLDTIAYNKRIGILNALKSIFDHRRNPEQIIAQVESVQDQLYSSGLYFQNIELNILSNELKNLTKLKRSVTDFRNNYESTKRSLEFITKKKQELIDLFTDVEARNTEIENLKVTSQNQLNEIIQFTQEAEEKKDEISDARKDVETKKLSIVAFSENIEEYKTIIEDIESRAKLVIEQDQKIKVLISSAEEAMRINSAYGISAAFSSQYDAASKKELTRGWIRGAILLLLLAVGLTVWAIGGWGINNPDSINTILGRVVAVALTITGAAFCAKQYVKQKNIAEDYAYKAVLSKSIIAFADEISGSDDDNNSYVGKYLEQVLSEIHQDPLRSRKDIDDSGFLSKRNVDKVAAIIKAAKGE